MKSITVESTDEYLGLTSHYPIGDWFRPDLEWTARIADKIDRHVRISLAGMAAERAWATGRNDLPDHWDKEVEQGGQSDARSAVILADYRTRAIDEYLQWMQREVDLLLSIESNWKAVEALAATLRKMPRLTTKEIKRIVIEARGGAPQVELVRVDGVITTRRL